METKTSKTNSDIPQDTAQRVPHNVVSGTNKKRLKKKTKQQADAVSHKASINEEDGNHSIKQSIGIQPVQNNSQVNTDSQDVLVTTKKAASTSDVDTSNKETSSLSESDSVSVTSEKRGKISLRSTAGAKKPSKLSVAITTSNSSSQRPPSKTRKPALLTQSEKKTKMLTVAADSKTDQTDTHVLKNSLPPLRQEHTESSGKTEKDSGIKINPELQPSPPKSSDMGSGNASEYSDITDTESVLSSLSAQKTGSQATGTTHSPQGQLPALTSVNEVKEDSPSSLLSNEESKTEAALPEQELETISKNTGTVARQTVEADDSIDEDIEEVLSESEEDTMFEESLHPSRKDIYKP